jgi:curved DNA-binding protein CbpA
MDLYKEMGLPKDASTQEIKQAYRTLCHKHHPDKGGNEDKFNDVAKAYAVLSNPDKRTRYDNGESPDAINDNVANLNAELSKLFFEIIAKHPNVDQIDIFEKMDSTLRSHQDTLRDQIVMKDLETMKLGKISKRIERDTSSKLFGSIIKEHVRYIEKSKQALERAIKLDGELLDKIKDCKMSVEAPGMGSGMGSGKYLDFKLPEFTDNGTFAW